jgi:hypothetical protein
MLTAPRQTTNGMTGSRPRQGLWSLGPPSASVGQSGCNGIYCIDKDQPKPVLWLTRYGLRSTLWHIHASFDIHNILDSPTWLAEQAADEPIRRRIGKQFGRGASSRLGQSAARIRAKVKALSGSQAPLAVRASDWLAALFLHAVHGSAFYIEKYLDFRLADGRRCLSRFLFLFLPFSSVCQDVE